MLSASGTATVRGDKLTVKSTVEGQTDTLEGTFVESNEEGHRIYQQGRRFMLLSKEMDGQRGIIVTDGNYDVLMVFVLE